MKMVTKALQCAKIEEKPWQREMINMLTAYRATPHSSTGIPPATFMFGRNIRTLLPEMVTVSNDPKAVEAEYHERMQKEKTKNTLTKKGVHESRAYRWVTWSC